MESLAEISKDVVDLGTRSDLWLAFFSALLGAVFGFLGSYFINRINLRDARRQRAGAVRQSNQLVARLLLLKLMSIHTNLTKLYLYIAPAFDDPSLKTDPPWSNVRAMANPPDRIDLTEREKAFAMDVPDATQKNTIIQIDVIHNAAIDGFRHYCTARQTLLDRLNELPTTRLVDQSLTQVVSSLTEEQKNRLDPQISSMNDLLKQFYNSWQRDSELARKCLEYFAKEFEKVHGMEIELNESISDPEISDVPAQEQ